MSIPEHRRRAFILPEQLTGHPLRSICFDIPDVAEYRQAFWGHLWALGENFVWEKTSNADTRDVQAAEYWRQILSINYTRWLDDEACDSDSCRTYPPNAPFIQWFPNDPYLSPDFVGEGYNAPAWYLATTASNIAYGSQTGDVITSLDRFPPGSLPDILPASGLPRFRINVSGEGTVKATLTNLFGGSLIQTTIDDDILSIKFIDVSRDTISLPPETQTDLTVEFEFTTPGAHHIDFIVVSWINSSIPFLHHGGGLRKVELCGFATMPVVSPPFRFTEECGLEYYNGEEWLPVEGWDDFAPACFTGPAGPAGADGADGHGIYIRETTTGLMQSDEPDFDPETLIYAYYRANATRPAVGFYGRDDLPYLKLYDNTPALKLALMVASAGQNELDTRESRFTLRWGAGATNNRTMFYNTDGTIQIVNNPAITPRAKWSLYHDNSSLDGMHLEGRTGLANQKALLSMRALNQTDTGGTNNGWALRIAGVNDTNYSLDSVTIPRHMFLIDKFANVDHGAIRNNRQLRTATPKYFQNAYREETVLLDESGDNYRSRMVSKVFVNNIASETMRQEMIGGQPAIGVLGHDASNVIDVGTVDCLGNAATKAALDALKAFGWIVGTINLGDIPSPEPSICDLTACQLAEVTARWFASEIFGVAAYWAGRYDEFMFQSERFDKIIANVDLHFANQETLGDWVNEIYLAYGAFDSSDSDLDDFLAEASEYINTTVAAQLACFMSDCGYLTVADYAVFVDQLNDTAGVNHWVKDLFRCIDHLGLATMTALSRNSAYAENLTLDCEALDCDNWYVTMNFNIDDWADSTNLVTGSYGAGGYFSEDGAVLRLEIPFRITFARFRVCGSEEGLTPLEIRVQNLTTSVFTDLTPLIDCKSYDWFGDSPDGIAIEITAPTGMGLQSILTNISLTGLGTEPQPDP